MNDYSLKNPDGTWKYTNKLADTTNPYLLQHAHNPINWHPWGEDAINLAKLEDKPLFISIGYSTCYWCHVMEREIFCDETIGEILNKYFVSIKIDREERPDLDEIYMLARQFITGESGWPNNVFLTHDLQPFFATGTFVRHKSGNAAISFKDLLTKIHQWWQQNRQDITRNAAKVAELTTKQLGKNNKMVANDIILNEKIIEKLSAAMAQHYDPEYGGFFGMPKFPNEAFILFLLRNNDPSSIAMALASLDKMAAGGIHDHIGGGFHRYAVDQTWRIPHFEKMLYNQAWLSSCYLEAYQITHNDYYKHVACAILDFVKQYLYSDAGGFYSAVDAETDGAEGRYYAWDEADIRSILSPQQAKTFFAYFAIAEIPGFPGHKHAKGGVIYCPDHSRLQQNFTKIQDIIALLAKTRAERKMPHIDNQVITAWHSMMIDSFTKAAYMLQRSDYATIAMQAANFLISECMHETGELYRVAKSASLVKGFAEDYAYAIQALLSVHQLTGKETWLTTAIALYNTASRLFQDNEGAGGYFLTEQKQDALGSFVRIKEAEDTTIPSANAIMIHNLVKFAEITGDKIWLQKADHLLNDFSQDIAMQPIRFPYMLDGLRYKIAVENSLGEFRLTAIETPRYTELTKKFTINLIFEASKGYYIYAHDANSEKFYPTTLEITGSPNLKLHKIKYPKATIHQNVSIYKGHFTISVTLSIEKVAEFHFLEPLDFTLSYQLCNDKACIKKAEIKEKLYIEVNEHSVNDN